MGFFKAPKGGSTTKTRETLDISLPFISGFSPLQNVSFSQFQTCQRDYLIS